MVGQYIQIKNKINKMAKYTLNNSYLVIWKDNLEIIEINYVETGFLHTIKNVFISDNNQDINNKIDELNLIETEDTINNIN